MTAISLRAPWEARSTKAKAAQYVSTHRQLESETEEVRVHRFLVQSLDIVLAATDFSEASNVSRCS